MASENFRQLTRHLAKADIDFDTADLRVLLVSSIPSETNLDEWVDRADVTNEVTGPGYTAGGISQPYTLEAFDSANNRQAITYTNRANGWTDATITAVGAIIYKHTGVAADDLLLHFVDFGGTVTSTAGNYSITYTAPFYINA